MASKAASQGLRRKLLFDTARLAVTLQRLCAEVIERHGGISGGFEDTVLIGLQPRGVVLADRLVGYLAKQLGGKADCGLRRPLLQGALDTTFHRDDYTSKRPASYRSYSTDIPFSLEGKRVILVDDVLYSGRATRAAMDALLAYGCPRQIELLVLVDRVNGRSFPIEASYVGLRVSVLAAQYVQLEFSDGADVIWLVDRSV